MILFANSEGPDQMQADLGLHCVHVPKGMFSHGEAHIKLWIKACLNSE